MRLVYLSVVSNRCHQPRCDLLLLTLYFFKVAYNSCKVDRMIKLNHSRGLSALLFAPVGVEMIPYRSRSGEVKVRGRNHCWKTLTVTRLLCGPQCKLNVPAAKQRFTVFWPRYETRLPFITSAAAGERGHFKTFARSDDSRVVPHETQAATELSQNNRGE